MSRFRSRWIALGILLVLLVGVAALAGGLATGGLAADTPGLLDFDPDEPAVEPGGTVEVNVTLTAMAGYGDDGVRSYEYVVAYDPSVLTATDVEPGPWLHQEAETDVIHETTIDDETGRVTVESTRDPPAGGVSDTGETATATISFEVADDAPPADAVLQFESASARTLEWGLPVLTTREAVVVIDGGGEERVPLDDGTGSDDGTGDGDDPGVTLADDVETGDATGDERTANRDEADQSTPIDSTVESADSAGVTDDDVPGFGILATLLAVGVLGAVGVRSADTTRPGA